MNKILTIFIGGTVALFSLQVSAARDCGGTPIVVDTGQDGFSFGTPGEFVYFDIEADGFEEKTQWVRFDGDEAFLALDLNGNGVIDDGSELFGSGTTLLENGEKARNGYIALAQYDAPFLGGNDDGFLTRKDYIFESLVFWLDINANGLSEEFEVVPVSETRFRVFETIPRGVDIFDDAGNQIVLESLAFSGKRLRNVYSVADVIFRRLEE